MYDNNGDAHDNVRLIKRMGMILVMVIKIITMST